MKPEYILNYMELQDGDIILTKQKGIFSWLIRYFLDSPYSHAIFMYNKTSYVHAITKNGVETNNIQRLFFTNESDVCVIRLKASFANRVNIINSAKNYVADQVAKQYGFITALKNGPLYSTKIKKSFKRILLYLIEKVLNRTRELEYRRYCSQLIASAFNSDNVGLFSNSNFCTPKDLYKSSDFEKVEISIIDINTLSDFEQAQLRSPNSLEENNKILRNCLKKIRKINRETEKIYSLGELDDFYELKLINNFYESKLINSNLDKQITCILKKRGYFDQRQRSLNNEYISYRYKTIDEFRKFINNQINAPTKVQSLLNQLEHLALSEIVRYKDLLKKVRFLHKQTGFEYYREQRKCYLDMYRMFITLKRNVANYHRDDSKCQNI